MGRPETARTTEEIIEEIRRLPADERVRLLRLLRVRLSPGDPVLLWDDFDDPEIDRLSKTSLSLGSVVLE